MGANFAEGWAGWHGGFEGAAGDVTVAGVACEEEFLGAAVVAVADFSIVRVGVLVVEMGLRIRVHWASFQDPRAPERRPTIEDAAAGEMLRGRTGHGHGAKADDIDARALPPVQLGNGIIRDAEASEPCGGTQADQEMDMAPSPGEGFQ